MDKKKVLITGAGGFIGHYLARFMKMKGYWVRGADLVRSKYAKSNDFDEFIISDLRVQKNCLKASLGVDWVFALAAQNGSIEFTTNVKSMIMRDNVLINVNTLEASVKNKVEKLFFSSSACVYPVDLQGEKAKYLKEDFVYPANPDSEYGWEKLFSERLYKSYEFDFGLSVRIGRFFNIYGPECIIDDPLRSKAPMALTKKIVESKNGKIKVWGDGGQVRSFCYIDDCINAIYLLMKSNIKEPINIGTSDHLSINKLAQICGSIDNKNIIIVNELGKIQGVRNRLCDYSKAKKLLGWQPKVSPYEGLKNVNLFIHQELDI